MWTLGPRSREVIKKAWKYKVLGSASFQLAQKIKTSRRDLLKWNKSVFGHIKTRRKDFEGQLTDLQNKIQTREDCSKVKEIKRSLEEVDEKESVMWKQKFIIQWAMKSDRNTSFFHTTTNRRRVCNWIIRIKNKEGEWIEENSEIAKEFENNFIKLFTSEDVT